MKAWMLALGMLLVAGCSKEKAAETTDAAVATTTTVDAAVVALSTDASTIDAATTAAVEDKPLPTEHRAENKATREITGATYKTEIEKLAKEIGAP